MKFLSTSAALLVLAASAPVQAQSVGLGASGQVNPPIGAPATVPSNIGTPINGQASPPLIPGKPVPGGVVDGAAKGAIKDGRTLSTGQAVDASANVTANQAMLTGGMRITDMGGAMDLGRVVSVAKDSAGKVSSVIVQTGDGVRRTMMPSGLTVKGGVAVTSQSEADLVALPVAK